MTKTHRQRHELAQAEHRLAQLDAMVRRQRSRGTVPPDVAMGWARKRYRQQRQLVPGTSWEAAMTPDLQGCLRGSAPKTMS